MTKLRFGQVLFDADLVVFDKDGTLIDFSMWGELATVWIERLSAGDSGLARDFYRSIGYDAEARRTDPRGPLAIATTGQIQAIMAATLYRHGVSWTEALDRIDSAYQTEDDYPLAGLVRPTGDLVDLLARLHGAGVRAAVVTTDHRPITEETLEILGIAHQVDQVICGDDGLPVKPAPDMLLAACRRLGIEPARTAVVGDTLGDLLMAERAGAGLRVGVLSGAGDRDLLAGHADAILDSVDDIAVMPARGGPQPGAGEPAPGRSDFGGL
jgi:phosphoglycolate phosphatase